MKILLVHNYYQQPGGEDRVFHQESELLKHNGHAVKQYIEHNNRINHINKYRLALDTIWSVSSYKKFIHLLKKFQPDVVHFHNTFPLISPSVYHACFKFNIPVIQTLHNFRLLCPAALFFRDGMVCEECLGKYFPYPGLKYSCYHESRLQSFVIGSMTTVHKILRTWKDKVDQYIVLTAFSKNKFIQGGVPATKISVKPNFVGKDPHLKNTSGSFALYIGRLSNEKGIFTLIRAFNQLLKIPLKVVGDGPLLEQIQSNIKNDNLKNISLIGRIEQQGVFNLLKSSKFLIFPSECYENFPMTIIEAFATGTPVIASRLGAMAEIVEDGKTGLLFNPGDPQDLAAKVKWAWEHPEEMAQMGQNARREYEQKYTAERNYEMLMAIYQKAIEMKRKGRGGGMGYKL